MADVLVPPDDPAVEPPPPGLAGVVRQALGFGGSSVVTTAIGGVATLLLAGNLPVATFGAYSFTTQVAMIVALVCEFGLFLPAARLLALGTDDERRPLLGAAIVTFLPVAAAATLAVFAVSFLAGPVFHVEAGPALRAMAPLAGVFPFALVAQQLAQGARRLHLYSAATVAGRLLFVVALAAFLAARTSLDLVTIVLLNATALLLAWVCLVILLRPSFRGVRVHARRFLHGARDYGFQVYLGRVLSTGTYNMDVLMVAALTDAESVAHYALAASITSLVALPGLAMSAALFRSLALQDRLQREQLVTCVAVSAAVGLAAAIAVGPFVRFFFAPAYAPVIPLSYILTAAGTIGSVTALYNGFLMAHGRGRELRNASIVLAASNITLNLLLIPAFGAIGAAWASLLALVANLVAHQRGYRASRLGDPGTPAPSRRWRAPARAWAAGALIVVLSPVIGVAVNRGGIYLMVLAGLAAGLLVSGLAPVIRAHGAPLWILTAGPAVAAGRVGQLTFNRAWVWIALVALLLGRRSDRSAPAVDRAARILGLFAAVYALRVIITPELDFSSKLGPLEAVLLPTAVFGLVSRSLSRSADIVGAIRRLSGTMALSGALLACIGIASWIFGFELASRSGGEARVDAALGGLVRISGPYAVPEVYGTVLSLTLASTMYWAMVDRRHRSRGLASAGLQILAIGLILFRAFWINELLVFFMVLGFRPRRPGRALAALVVGGCLLLVVGPQLRSNDVIGARLTNEANVTGRFAVYQVGLDIWRTQPLLGVGVDQFVPAEKALSGGLATGARGVVFPHSSFVAVLAEQGLVGLGAALAAIAAAGWLCLALWRQARTREEGILAATVTASVIVYLLTSATLTMIPYGDSNAMLAVFLAVACARLRARRSQPGPAALGTVIDLTEGERRPLATTRPGRP